MHYETKILHEGGDKDPYTGALSIPIYPASTYHQKNVDVRQEFDYSRSGNPTRAALERTLAVLENGSHGYAFSSGVAAITAAITAVCSAGDHIVATRDCYGGTYRLLTKYLSRLGITHTFVDTTDIAATEHAITSATKVLFLESPSNPLLRIIDFTAMTALAKKHSLITMLDNTFLSPYLFRPLDIGVDVSIHSATKFLGGHSDLIAGAVVTKNGEIAAQIYAVQNGTGNMLSPENSWLLLRGIKTLRARMEMQCAGAMELATWLSKQSWVTKVYYPGLADHPGHETIRREAKGFGAVVSFTADTIERTRAILQHVRIWTVAVSLGGVESILSYPAKMSHAAMPKDERDALGISDTLIRLSIGLEHTEDLIDDLKSSAEIKS
ncbi:MAG: PLP-dependent transferase [Spirochaetes bacterium]|nr:PLP-dependent transferase [Spirochaetota bacterium]